MARTGSDAEVLAAVVEALAAAKLEAIVVGATAAILRGAPLMTADVDLLVRDTPRNRQKFEAFARELGAAKPRPVSEISSALTVEGGPIPIDLLLEALPGNLRFAAVRSRAERMRIGGGAIRVASLEDIIRSKMASARPKDAYHIEVLRQVMALRDALAGDDDGSRSGSGS